MPIRDKREVFLDDRYGLLLTKKQSAVLNACLNNPYNLNYHEIARLISCRPNYVSKTMIMYKNGTLGNRIKGNGEYTRKPIPSADQPKPVGDPATFRLIPCNRCGKKFYSQHKGNRRCPGCEASIKAMGMED